MRVSRREFLTTSAAFAIMPATSVQTPVARDRRQEARERPPERFDPWVEVLPDALAHNVRTIRQLGGRPILAVIKNHGYGLDFRIVARLLEPNPDVAGFALVRAEEAVALREGGISKPILLMARAPDDAIAELAARRVTLSVYADDDPARMTAAGAQMPIEVHAYLDTGMSRMGIAYHRALPFLREVAATPALRLTGTFMTFTEEADFDREQRARFVSLASEASAAGISLGRLHAASSHSIFHHRDVGFDLIRPGMALYGGYPGDAAVERPLAALRPAFRLRARVARTDRLRAGDSVSYGRRYIAREPTWVATLPVGHGDGYPRDAVKGARVLVGDALYPVIGAISASHCIIEVGAEERVRVGDVATLIGPDRPEIHPNAVAEVTGSVYDLLMHLNPTLPRVVEPRR
jgi:alanine racemase